MYTVKIVNLELLKIIFMCLNGRMDYVHNRPLNVSVMIGNVLLTTETIQSKPIYTVRFLLKVAQSSFLIPLILIL